jgi:hypothetical protein
MLSSVLQRIWKILISLKLAVLVIASLAVALAVATFVESSEGTKAAQYFIYRATWFYGLLTLLGLNILAVALSRLPWKKRHLPFLLAHAGILMLLFGSYLTFTNGLDGMMRIDEGDTQSAIELEEHYLVFERAGAVETVSVPWVPSSERFSPKRYEKYGVESMTYIPWSEPKTEFVSDENNLEAAALQLKVQGPAFIGAVPDLWLWGGDPAWATLSMGPARFSLVKDISRSLIPETPGQAHLILSVLSSGKVKFRAVSPRGEVKQGVVAAGETVNPGWRMPIRILVRKVLPHAENRSRLVDARVRPMGTNVQPAIEIASMTNKKRHWLSLGDRIPLTGAGNEQVTVGFFPRRVILPFGLRLEKFDLKVYPGTQNPAAYQSLVTVMDRIPSAQEDMSQNERLISMNEPLTHAGYTFYQASYIPGQPRPTTTILSVNADPGRTLKYLGSLLIVLGSISLYAIKSFGNRSKEKVKSS